MDRMALGRMRLGAFSMYSYFRCRVGGGRIQAFRAGQIISLGGGHVEADTGRIVRLLWVCWVTASALSTNRIWHLQTNENEEKHMKKI